MIDLGTIARLSYLRNYSDAIFSLIKDTAEASSTDKADYAYILKKLENARKEIVKAVERAELED